MKFNLYQNYCAHAYVTDQTSPGMIGLADETVLVIKLLRKTGMSTLLGACLPQELGSCGPQVANHAHINQVNVLHTRNSVDFWLA